MSVAKAERALVIGDGAWGTALALQLVKNGVPTTLWSHDHAHSERMRKERTNAAFLPGVELPPELELSGDPFSAAEGVDLVISVVPTQFVRGVAQRFEDALDGNLPLVTATKGFEIETLRRPSQILTEVLGKRTICALTGPSHAEEVARGLPASVVAASEDDAFAALVQASFGGETFRVYTSSDAAGAEIAGAIKNVIAVAAGIGDGLELGDNAKAALVTRGVVEMARYGSMHGGRSETFFGLAGIGDLITTCCSKHSRNRAVGEAIGRGRSLQDILAASTSVAEGVWTTQALFGPESEVSVDMPIAEQVYAVLYEGKDPRAAVAALMQRAPVEEMRGLA